MRQLEAKENAQKLYVMCMESKGYRLTCPPAMHLNDDRDKCKPDSEKRARLRAGPMTEESAYYCVDPRGAKGK